MQKEGQRDTRGTRKKRTVVKRTQIRCRRATPIARTCVPGRASSQEMCGGEATLGMVFLDNGGHLEPLRYNGGLLTGAQGGPWHSTSICPAHNKAVSQLPGKGPVTWAWQGVVGCVGKVLTFLGASRSAPGLNGRKDSMKPGKQLCPAGREQE